jgi:hypothetical protein
MDDKRNFHPGWAKRPSGCHHKPFTRELWTSWLAELNREPAPELTDGLSEMRHRLALWDLPKGLRGVGR